MTKEVTAIAWKFLDWRAQAKPVCFVLGRVSPIDMLMEFKEAFDAADMVTGHFIRGYDLPVLQGAFAEYELPLLGPKLTHDTKNDLLRMSGLSKSQENLAAMLNVFSPKISMDQAQWRNANRLSASGIARTMDRVIGDVTQHIELRQRLLEAGMLGPPRVWHPSAGGGKTYVG